MRGLGVADQPWWRRLPDRYQHELAALRDAEIHYAIDEEEMDRGRLVLNLFPPSDIWSRGTELLARFPDSYPYFRPQVFEKEPSGLSGYHQNPLTPHGVNLCLLSRPTESWGINETLAGILKSQLPSWELAVDGDDPEAARAVSDNQGEPFTEYYPYCPHSALLVPDTEIPPEVTWGTLKVVLWDKPNAHQGQPVHGAVLEVKDSEGEVVAALDPSIAREFTKKDCKYLSNMPWHRRREPVPDMDNNTAFNRLVEEYPGRRGNSHPGNNIHKYKHGAYVAAALFPIEVGVDRTGDGWLFVSLEGHSTGKGRKRLHHSHTYFTKAIPAGSGTFQERAKELTPLRGKTVGLIGVGGIGSTIAQQLAQAGVGELRLWDSDRVEFGNSVRWAGGLPLVGWPKVELGRLLQEHYPLTAIKWQEPAFRHALGRPTEGESCELWWIEQFLEGVDLVIDASAESGIHSLIANICWTQGYPYLWASTVNGVWEGIVGRSVPGVTEGCWKCHRHWLDVDDLEKGIPAPRGMPSGFIQPKGCGDVTFTGAGFDAALISSMATRLAVGELCRNEVDGYPNPNWDVAVVRLRDGQDLMLQSETRNLFRHPDCVHDGSW